jgi:hypothetical protein
MTKPTNSVRGRRVPKQRSSPDRISERRAGQRQRRIDAHRMHEREAVQRREQRRPFAARVPEGHCTSAG